MSSTATAEPSLALPIPPKPFFDSMSISTTLLIWDILIGLPISYLLTMIIGTVLRNESVVLSRMLFMGLNLALVSAWAIWLTEEQEKERMERLEKEIRRWDTELVMLEEVLEDVQRRVAKEEKRAAMVRQEEKMEEEEVEEEKAEEEEVVEDNEETEEESEERVIDDSEESDESVWEGVSTSSTENTGPSFAF